MPSLDRFPLKTSLKKCKIPYQRCVLVVISIVPRGRFIKENAYFTYLDARIGRHHFLALLAYLRELIREYLLK